MPARAIFLILCIVVFLATTFARAEDCACPVIQCEPCQKKLFLGSEKKQCTQTQAIDCDKFVCENADNYFQCISGTPPLYIPPQDPSLRYTEPRYSTQVAQEKPNSLDVQFSTEVEKAAPAVIEEKSELLPDGQDDSVTVRAPASVKSVKEIFEPATDFFFVKNLTGKIIVKEPGLKKPQKIKKSKKFLKTTTFEFLTKAEMSLSFASDQVTCKYAKGSVVALGVQDGVFVSHLQQGQMDCRVVSSRDLFVVDLGEWRFGKKSGAFQISRQGVATTVHNMSVDAYLRRESIISNTVVLQQNQKLQFEEGVDLYVDVSDENKNKNKEYVLSEVSSEKKKERDVAAEAFCQSPQGQYEQCAWKCFGAKPGAESCASPQAKAPGQCVRFTCSADGQWKLPTIVSGGECSTEKIHVGSCH